MDSQPSSLSPVSYKSTHSSRSSVLERAREYNRRIEDQKHGLLGIQHSSGHYNNNYNNSNNDRRRSKSLERGSLDPFGMNAGSVASGGNSISNDTNRSTMSSQQHHHVQRSHSAGRAPQYFYPDNEDPNATTTNYSPTRNRAMMSVSHNNNKHSNNTNKKLQPPSATSSSFPNNHNSYKSFGVTPPQQQPPPVVSNTTKTPIKSNHTYNRESTQQQQQRYNNINNNSNTLTPTTATTATQSSGHVHRSRTEHSNTRLLVDEKKEETRILAPDQHQPQQPPALNENHGPVVTPELLVDALSGHEDGLLAIAEKLMEHYDSGYDVMGEAIIDAFADVQKLFQHVVEAAHMEGAAFESARREEEMKQRQKDGQLSMGDGSIVAGSDNNRLPVTPGSPPTGGPTRHDEFIDQDVKDVLADAIRQGSTLRAERKDTQCYQLFTSACQDASSMLPVDSDHRGRLQLSIARAESMSPDRACAILRYAMDDVLRSGLRAHHPTPIPDPSNRADVVLNRNMTAGTGNNAIVQQSHDEALASLMEELKDILQAPIYHDTPLQHVASRFWNALAESQKMQHRNEARLEQNLGKLKGEFLLARAEWEEKLSQSNIVAENYRQQYEKLLGTTQKDGFAERSFATARTQDGTNTNDDSNSLHYNNIDLSSVYGSVKSAASKAETVASGVSGFAQHARSLVMNSGFNCVAPSDNNIRSHNDHYDGDDGMLDSHDGSEFDSNPPVQHQRSTAPVPRGRSTNSRSRSRPKTTSQNQRFQEYSRSPHRLDI